MMTNVTCSTVEALIARRVDGALQPDDEVALNRHLDACQACRTTLQSHAALAGVVASRIDAAPPLELRARIGARLDQEVDWLDMANWRIWTYRLAPLAAMLTLVAASMLPLAVGDQAEGIESAQAVDMAAVAESWALGDSETLTTTALFWQPNVTAESLLEVVLTARPDDPLEGASDER